MTAYSVRVMHCSMQFSDSREHKKHDAQKILTRARSHNVWWLTGTEAGPAQQDMRLLLHNYGQRFDYKFWFYGDAWVMVDLRKIAAGTYRPEEIPVLSARAGKGTHAERGITSVTFKNPHLGKITVGAAHYLTMGARKGQPNYDENSRLTRAIGGWGAKAGAGKGLVFLGADTNTDDRSQDVFRGRPFTTMADELKHYEGSGPGGGPIDVIASYNPDRRVRAKSWNVLKDKEFFLYSDHSACEGVFEVRSV